MKFNSQSTPLQSSDDTILLYMGSVSNLVRNETELIALGTSEPANLSMLVRVDVIRTYQQIIFDLERRVLQYQQLLFKMTEQPYIAEDEPVAQLSAPLNSASVDTVNSILGARIPEDAVLRAFDEEEI